MSSRVTCDGCGAEIAKGRPSIGITVNVGSVYENADACSERCVQKALERAGEVAVGRLLAAMHGKGPKS